MFLVLRLKKIVVILIKFNGFNGIDILSRKNNVDRFVRWKSVRVFVDCVISGVISDDEVEEGDIVREIYEFSEDEEDEEDEEGEEENLNGEIELIIIFFKFVFG